MKTVLSLSSWPLVFFSGLLLTHFAFESERPMFGFALVYTGEVLLLLLLERYIPYERHWLLPDGETANNIAHTLLTKGAVQLFALVGAVFPMLTATVLQPFAGARFDLWPTAPPMPFQVAIAVVVAEFGLYWAHRIAHERLFFWRFHALHHSVIRLWVVNTGRFHIADSLFKVALSQLPIYLLGAPLQVFWWLGAITAFMGILTHGNVDMRTGIFDYIFSTPRLHRWHHSKDMREGNTNYGENVVFFDLLFGTYFNPDRPSSTDIGIRGEVAKNFLGQLAQPFRKEGIRQILGRPTKSG